jgi:hypothetical protein
VRLGSAFLALLVCLAAGYNLRPRSRLTETAVQQPPAAAGIRDSRPVNRAVPNPGAFPGPKELGGEYVQGCGLCNKYLNLKLDGSYSLQYEYCLGRDEVAGRWTLQHATVTLEELSVVGRPPKRPRSLFVMDLGNRLVLVPPDYWDRFRRGGSLEIFTFQREDQLAENLFAQWLQDEEAPLLCGPDAIEFSDD